MAIVVVVGAVGVVGFLAGRRAVDTAPPLPEPAAPAQIVAERGSLLVEERTRATVQWVVIDTFRARRGGTVTAQSLSPATVANVENGAVLYELDEAPVVAIKGQTPAYRDIDRGSEGDDVTQLQQFLSETGFLDSGVNGVWGADSASAWSDWLESIGHRGSDTVPLGTVRYLPDLPMVIVPEPSLTVGAVVAGGDPTIRVLAPVPEFTIQARPGASDAIEPGLAVSIDIHDESLSLVTAQTVIDPDDGSTTTRLVANGGEELRCGAWCDAISPREPSVVPATIVLAGPASGTIVPVGALRSGAGDETVVVTAAGETVRVVVVLEVDGSAVVEGIDDGTVLELPLDDQSDDS